jgi:hypothetical protein
MTGPTPTTGPKPISVLDAVTTANSGDILYLVRDGVTDHHITFANLIKASATATHTHVIADVTGLQGQLDTLATNVGAAGTNITTLQGQMAGKAATSHTHTMGQVTGLDTALADKAATNHTHSTAQVTGLDTALAGKAPTTHSHATSQITGLDAALAARALSVHSHTAGQITDFAESVDDRVDSLITLVPGSALVKVYDDTANTLNLRVDIDNLTETTTVDPVNDFFPVRKAAGGALFKVKGQYLPGTGGGGGGTSYTLPVASTTTLGGVKLSPQFAIATDGTLTLVSQGNTAQGQIRCVTPENFGGSLGTGKTDQVRRANLSAFNDMLAYCKTNQYAAYVTPGGWEIAGGHIRQDNRGGAIHVFGYRSHITQFSDGEVIWEIAGDGGTFTDVTLEYSVQQSTGDAVGTNGTLKTDFVIISGGSGYTSAPTVTITPDPRDASGFNAAATAIVTDGVVTALTLTNAGVRYTYPPIVSISGGGGSGATAVSKVNMPHAGLRMLAARYNNVKHIQIRKAWVGLLSTNASPSERNSFDEIDVIKPGHRGVAFTSGAGNDWGSIYVRGDGVVHPCEGGVFFFGQGNSSVDLIHIESLACRYPVEISFSNFGTIDSLKLIGVRPIFQFDPPKNSVCVLVKSASRGVIGSVVIDGLDLQGTDAAARPARCKIFAHQNVARVRVLDVTVTNTKNKDASTSLVFVGPSGTSAIDNRSVGFAFGQVSLNRDSATPHLIDRLTDYVADTPNSFTQALLTYNVGLGGVVGYSAPWGDADVTIYPEPHGQVQEFATPLTANRSVVISGRLDAPYVSDTVQSPLLCRGFKQRIVRALTATGAFSHLVKNDAGTTLATLSSPGDWVELFHNGTAWVIWDASIQVVGDPKTVLGFDASGNAKAVPNLRAVVLPVTGETAALAAGTNLFKMHLPFAFKVTDVKLGVNTASTTGNITVNVKAGGTTLFSTKPTIAQGAEASGVAGKPVLSLTDIASDAALTVDIDAAGTGAKGLKVYVIGYQT